MSHLNLSENTGLQLKIVILLVHQVYGLGLCVEYQKIRCLIILFSVKFTYCGNFGTPLQGLQILKQNRFTI